MTPDQARALWDRLSAETQNGLIESIRKAGELVKQVDAAITAAAERGADEAEEYANRGSDEG